MTDTPQHVEARVRKLMKCRSGAERLCMGFSMYDAAKKIVVNSIFSGHSAVSSGELKFKIFLRFYKSDFNPEECEKIKRHLMVNVEG